MKDFEFKSAICTSVEQSKRLLELGLKKETADCGMYWAEMEERWIYFMQNNKAGILCSLCEDEIPAWSLHRLINLLPVEVTHNGYKFQLRKDVLSKIDDIDNVYDEVIGVIQRAIELDSFNKDYLEEREL